MKPLLLAALLLATPAAAAQIDEDEYAACMIGTGVVALLKGGAHDVVSARAAAVALCAAPEMAPDDAEGLSDFVEMSLLAVADRLYGPGQ